jgi:predicted dehydrogenase
LFIKLFRTLAEETPPMFQPPYRAAVIGRTGQGNYGHGLDLAFLNEPRLKVVAVADDNPKGLADAAKRLKVDHAYADYRTMLDREKPRFVAVAPRWIDCHREMILACAECGVHVLSEKPLAPTLADCDAIVEACERSHVKLAIAFQTRYSPRLERIKELIAAGAIGEILELRGRGKDERRGGGEDLMVLGVHIFDLFRAFLGDPSWCFARVTEGGKPAGPEQAHLAGESIGPITGDRVDALYGFKAGPVVAHFATARTKEPGGRFGLQIFGTRGTIAMGTGWLAPAFLRDGPVWNGTAQGAKWVEITSAGPGKPEPLAGNALVEGNRALVADLIHAVETDTQPRAGVYDGRAAVEMVLACYASSLKNGPVSFPLADRAKHPLESE